MNDHKDELSSRHTLATHHEFCHRVKPGKRVQETLIVRASANGTDSVGVSPTANSSFP